MKKGRPHEPARLSDGRNVDGLAKLKDGRWKIVATGERFTADEATAVRRFNAVTGAKELAFIPISDPSQDPADSATVADQLNQDTGEVQTIQHEDGSEQIGWAVDRQKAYAWFADQLALDAHEVAKGTGIASLANYATMTLPKPPIKLKRLRAIYKERATCAKQSRNQVLARFNDFCSSTGADTVPELTTKILIDWSAQMAQTYKRETVKFYIGCVRTVLNAGIKVGEDVEQIESLKRRMKVISLPPIGDEAEPHPISPEHFHKLLATVAETRTPDLWRAWLLLSLNAALYMEDLCSLKWDDLDLTEGYYLSRRKKRGRCIRAAVLWDESIAALKAISRRGESPYVFTSTHGTRYNRNTKINDFKDLCKKAGVEGVTWSHLRDGAYTAACNAAGVDEKFARILAGHKAPGEQDKYVQRNPKCVAPACQAVYAHYFEKQKNQT